MWRAVEGGRAANPGSPQSGLLSSESPEDCPRPSHGLRRCWPNARVTETTSHYPSRLGHCANTSPPPQRPKHIVHAHTCTCTCTCVPHPTHLTSTHTATTQNDTCLPSVFLNLRVKETANTLPETLAHSPYTPHPLPRQSAAPWEAHAICPPKHRNQGTGFPAKPRGTGSLQVEGTSVSSIAFLPLIS